MSTIPAERLAEVFVEVADTLVDDFDLIDFLATVTARVADLSSAAAAGLLLGDAEGNLQFMAASDESARMLELFQVQIDEGPCRDCFTSGEPVVNADLSEASDRWPQFAPRAQAEGFLSVHAFPLRHRRSVIGALNVFGREPGRLADQDVRVVQALADVATIGLLQERAIRHGEVLTEQLQSALNSRITIEQAKGALAQLRHVTPDEAFTLMRDYARSRRLHLGDVAREVVTDQGSHPELTSSTRTPHNGEQPPPG
ncbi:MAG TPA: GAF and ANTAR domain-containing protein [Pedococcus sp.]|jgi:transcriptional regulator with GAF, ATPase, and Fis domain|nr:GAF and ANTAR domain-containing protein [Pedococcus sp.]